MPASPRLASGAQPTLRSGRFRRDSLWYHPPAMATALSDTELKDRIKRLIVDRLKLETEPSDIADDQPLFGEGLGLDSIDALELVLGLEQEFGVKIEDEEVGGEALASVDALAAFVRDKSAAPA
jgi:acyl carrier protein